MAAICAQLRSNTDVYYRFQEKGSAVACYHGWIEVQPKAEQSLCISGRLAVDFPESFSLAHTDPKLPLGGEASVIRTPSCRRTRSDQTEVFQHRFQFWHLASEEEKSRAMAESPSTGFIVACFPPFAAAADLSVCDHFHIMVMYDQCNQITFFSNTIKKHISKSVTLGN